MLGRSISDRWSPVALVACLLVTSVASGAHAVPSCPAGATLVTTNQTFVTANTGVKCVVAGVSVSIDIQAYSSATIFTEANVGVDVEAYSSATIHVLGGTIGADIDSYGSGATINVYAVDLLGNMSAYDDSTINLFGGHIAGQLIVYDGARINVFANSLSSHPFGDIADPTGTIEGMFEDGSAFALGFHRNGTGIISLIFIPEPDTFALLGFALGGMALVRRYTTRRGRTSARGQRTRARAPTTCTR